MNNLASQSRSCLGFGSIVLVLSILLLSAVAVAQSSSAPKLTTLYSFTNGADGGHPYGGSLILDGAGNLYGTTPGGGAGSRGTVFKLSKTGKETVLHAFTGANGDGASPFSGVTMDNAGNLYGTTRNGGSSNSGTVFKLDKTGKESVLYSFTGSDDGGQPQTSLFRDAAGNLYGTATNGGSSKGGKVCQAFGCGVVFKLSSRGKETVLYNFTGSGGDGLYPVNFSVLGDDAKGNLYGTTEGGGDTSCSTLGCGIVFKVDPKGKETVLYTFTSTNNGLTNSGLVRDTAGNLYGTTAGNCSTGTYGTVFKVDTKGKEKILYTFSGGKDGGCPQVNPILDAAGNLYGVTGFGGTGCQGLGCGVVFKLNKSGKETVLYRFKGESDGAFPNAGLVMDKAGNLYGTTNTDGSGGAGTVFKLKP
jgi:uncharacterized repeat protein (TIGR03803 family)